MKEDFPKAYGEWIELNQRIAYSNPWIEVRHSEVVNPNGGEGIYGVVHFKNLAIGVMAIDEFDQLYLVGQERFPFQGAYSWEIVQGGGPLHEDPLVSAKRELQEEAGLEAKQWKLLQELHLSNSATDEKALIYVANDLRQIAAAPEETEKLEVKCLPFKEACRWVKQGKIVDSISVAAILRMAAERGGW